MDAGPFELLRHPKVVLVDDAGNAVREGVHRGGFPFGPHGPDELVLEPLANLLFRQSEHVLTFSAGCKTSVARLAPECIGVSADRSRGRPIRAPHMDGRRSSRLHGRHDP